MTLGDVLASVAKEKKIDNTPLPSPKKAVLHGDMKRGPLAAGDYSKVHPGDMQSIARIYQSTWDQ